MSRIIYPILFIVATLLFLANVSLVADPLVSLPSVLSDVAAAGRRGGWGIFIVGGGMFAGVIGAGLEVMNRLRSQIAPVPRAHVAMARVAIAYGVLWLAWLAGRIVS